VIDTAEPIPGFETGWQVSGTTALGEEDRREVQWRETFRYARRWSDPLRMFELFVSGPPTNQRLRRPKGLPGLGAIFPELDYTRDSGPSMVTASVTWHLGS
jgi:hypothetical protein